MLKLLLLLILLPPPLLQTRRYVSQIRSFVDAYYRPGGLPVAQPTVLTITVNGAGALLCVTKN